MFLKRFALRGRDPAMADENLYRYCGNEPTDHTDPSGCGDDDDSSQAMEAAFAKLQNVRANTAEYDKVYYGGQNLADLSMEVQANSGDKISISGYQDVTLANTERDENGKLIAKYETDDGGNVVFKATLPKGCKTSPSSLHWLQVVHHYAKTTGGEPLHNLPGYDTAKEQLWHVDSNSTNENEPWYEKESLKNGVIVAGEYIQTADSLAIMDKPATTGMKDFDQDKVFSAEFVTILMCGSEVLYRATWTITTQYVTGAGGRGGQWKATVGNAKQLRADQIPKSCRARSCKETAT